MVCKGSRFGSAADGYSILKSEITRSVLGVVFVMSSKEAALDKQRCCGVEGDAFWERT